jgi:hypothetical protein
MEANNMKVMISEKSGTKRMKLYSRNDKDNTAERSSAER